MATTLGEKRIVRFAFDDEVKKIVIAFKTPVIENDFVVSEIEQHMVSRNEDYDSLIARLLPDGINVEEAFKMLSEKIERDKLEKQNKENKRV